MPRSFKSLSIHKKTLDDLVEEYRTNCCKSKIVAIEKGEYNCGSCGENVSGWFYYYIKEKTDATIHRRVLKSAKER